MNDEQSPALAAIASAILDGAPIDWTTMEGASSSESRPLIEELRLVATLADAHRHISAADDDAAATTGMARYWGRLRLIEQIASGSFGDVYRAWDPRLRREVALKIIASNDPDGRQSASFLHEARLLARARHPGVVTIYDAAEIEGVVGLSMEYVRGHTIEQRLRTAGAFRPADTIAIGSQLCDALAAAHDAGVLHRDVKAANVVMRPDGRVVLMDFGAGRHRRQRADSGAGTPLYLAPEVLEGDDSTARSDIYSLGVLLYHMLTGAYPVEATSLAGLRAAHARRQANPVGIRARCPATPSRLAAVIDRAIHPDPAERFASAAALGQALRSTRGLALSRGLMLALTLSVGLLVAGSTWMLGLTGPSSPSPADPVRLAVVPFTSDAVGTTDDELRATMTRALTARLQRFDNARVTASASAFNLAAGLSPSEIGDRLDVTVLLAGTLEQEEGRLGMSLRLIDVADGSTAWSHHYTAFELSTLLTEATQGVADALRLTRGGGVSGWPTPHPEAFALFVRGRAALDRFTDDGTLVAHGLFIRALKIDPGYADVHAALAEIYLQMKPAIPNLSGEEAERRGVDAAEQALAIDPTLPAAWAALAGVKAQRRDWAGAERDYLRAIEYGPSDLIARRQYARWLSLLGRADESVAQARILERLDPESPRTLLGVASVLRFARRYDETIAYADRILKMDAGYSAAWHAMGHGYQGLGRLEEAISAFERMKRPGGNLGHVYALSGRVAQARALAAQIEQEYASTGLRAGEIAQIYAGLGEIDRAFYWLDRATEGGMSSPATFKVAIVWDPLRSDPRFAALLKRTALD